jgi:hypothetical protein
MRAIFVVFVVLAACASSGGGALLASQASEARAARYKASVETAQGVARSVIEERYGVIDDQEPARSIWICRTEAGEPCAEGDPAAYFSFQVQAVAETDDDGTRVVVGASLKRPGDDKRTDVPAWLQRESDETQVAIDKKLAPAR